MLVQLLFMYNCNSDSIKQAEQPNREQIKKLLELVHKHKSNPQLVKKQGRLLVEILQYVDTKEYNDLKEEIADLLVIDLASANPATLYSEYIGSIYRIKHERVVKWIISECIRLIKTAQGDVLLQAFSQASRLIAKCPLVTTSQIEEIFLEALKVFKVNGFVGSTVSDIITYKPNIVKQLQQKLVYSKSGICIADELSQIAAKSANGRVEFVSVFPEESIKHMQDLQPWLLRRSLKTIVSFLVKYERKDATVCKILY